jgi:uncharacterized protein
VSESRLELRLDLPVSVQAAWDWHMRPEAFLDLTPPWRKVSVVETDGEIADGSRVLIRLHLGPFHKDWEAIHEKVRPPHGFRDVQKRGPFAAWRHDHLFESRGPDACTLIDRIHYRLPFGALGKLVAGAFVRRDLERLFAHRHQVTLAALEAEARGENS